MADPGGLIRSEVRATLVEVRVVLAYAEAALGRLSAVVEAEQVLPGILVMDQLQALCVDIQVDLQALELCTRSSGPTV